MLNVDLHCHSTCSDGTLPVAELAQRAVDNGVQVWALTDHDETAGLAQARAVAEAGGIRFINGVEISVTFARKTVHIVGLGFDADHPQLLQGLQSIRDGRDQRGLRMAQELEEAGVAHALEGARKYADNPQLLSRTHFARYLVELGVCSDMNEVFSRYLTEGKPGYVEHNWTTLAQALHWIHAAGGVAVIAHPARYRFSPNEEYALFTDFTEHGGKAVEAVTGSHSEHEYATYAQLAQEFGLYLSRGSDFHCPRESRHDLGCLPPDPAGVPSVLELLH